MPTTAMVHVRVDEKVKERANRSLSAMGLSISDAVRMLLVRVATENALPFEVKVPNAETVKTLQETENGENLEYFENTEDMFNNLGI
ncbi:MAG: type II toxin-antitoxin system RelB/DinJ family antitoxin [Alphaproteobacteria bacterium]